MTAIGMETFLSRPVNRAPSDAERTVRAHLTDIFHALGVQTRVQAILRAREMGLIR